MLGAIMWTFSSYFIILITAGHIWKLMTLCFIPPTIAGIIHTYRGRYLLGGAMTALFAALQILSNHVQMSYYFAFLIVFLLIGYFVEALRGKALRSSSSPPASPSLQALSLSASTARTSITPMNMGRRRSVVVANSRPKLPKATNSKYRLPLRASTRNTSLPGATARVRPSHSLSPTSMVEHRVHSAKAQQIWRMSLPNSSRSSEG